MQTTNNIVQNIDSLAHTTAQVGLVPVLVAFMVVLVVFIVLSNLVSARRAQAAQEQMLARQQASQERMLGVYEANLEKLTTTHERGMNNIASELKNQGQAIQALANRMSRIEGRLDMDEEVQA